MKNFTNFLKENEAIIKKGDYYHWENIKGDKFFGEIVEIDNNDVIVKLPSGEIKSTTFFIANWKSNPNNKGETLVKIINPK